MRAAWRRVFAVRSQWRLAAALLLLLAAVLMPEVNVTRRVYDYVVTFDVTQSMNVEDVELDGKTVRRIVLARAAMRDVLRHLPCGSKVGWSVFAGYRSFVLLMPVEVCANYDVLLASLDKVGDAMRWQNASSVAKGVYWAMRNAKAVTPSRFVFITDGQEAPAVALDTSIAPPTEPGEVDGILVGVGGSTPSRIPKTGTDGAVTGYWSHDEVQQASGDATGDGHEELSELREQYLGDLARANGVAYQTLDAPDALTPALLQSRFALRAAAPTNVRWVPALAALLLLVWNYLPMPARRRRRAAAPVAHHPAPQVAESVS